LLDPNTIRRYKELFESGGIERLCSSNYLGRESKLTKKQEEILKKELRMQIYVSTGEIIDFVKKEWEIEYSQSGMTYLLHRLGFSYKKPNLVPGKANEEDQRLFLAELERLKRKKKPGDKLFYIDGVHPQHNSLPSYGWLPRGEETKLKSNTGRQRANISGALDAETHEAHV
jgi:transposase